MKIWKKIILGFISVIIIMIIVDGVALLNNIKIIDDVEDLEYSKRLELTHSNNAAYNLQRIKSNLRELFLEVKEGKRENEITTAREVVESNSIDLNESLQALYKATIAGLSYAKGKDDEQGELNEIEMIDSLDSLVGELTSGIQTILDLEEKQKFEEAERFFEAHVEPLSREIQKLLQVIVKDAEEEISWAIQRLSLKVDQSIKFGLILTILSILLSMAIGLYISRSISGPLNKLIYGTNEIRNGNLETSVNLNTKGELQQLADSFNEMTAELKTRISAINQLNEELKESNQTKDKFFSIIAHDLRNPFNAILGFTDLLVTRYQDFNEEERRRIIEELHKSSVIVYELLDNLLTWARSQSQKIDLFPDKLDVFSLVDKSIVSHSGNAKQKNIRIENNISESTFVRADEFTLTVVINNILTNAIKFTSDNGFIKMNAGKKNDMIEICIQDSGVGMEQEIIDNLLASTNIESQPGTRHEKGTGLGLILIKDFITRNNGNLSITSQPGNGTKVCITLPMAI